MRSLFLFTSALLLAVTLAAQRSQGGLPVEWEVPDLDRSNVPEVTFGDPGPDLVPSDPSEGGFQYGVQRFLGVDIIAEGDWETLPDGRRLCRLMLRSPGAVMISVQFDQWDLHEGGLVYLYNEDRSFFIGGFDHTNRAADGTMATAVVPGDAVVIEYRLLGDVDPGSLRVASITHGTVDIFGFGEAGYLRDYYPGYNSAPCHINVACPEAADWQLHKRSVLMFLRPNGHGCTGSLINNTAEPGRPYFNAANHCYQPTESQWVFYFNYEAPACVGDQGPTTQTLTGATVRASWYWTDLLLMELNDAPPPAYGAYYHGWDRSGSTPQGQTVIQHPLYDVKKIAIDHDPATSYVNDVGMQLWKNFWDEGIVQAVSSGSPLFDHNKRFIGHMTEGAQECGTNATDSTGCIKMSMMWDGTQPDRRMRDWLDPPNTAMTLDGFDPNDVPSVRVRLRAFLEGPFNTTSTLMDATLRESGLLPLQEPYTALGYAHVGLGGGELTTQAVLNVVGNDAVVDWVVVELRDASTPSAVLATRSALIKKNGYVVDIDGSSDVYFDQPPGNYFIALRHRNHLGVMTAAAQPLSSTAVLINLSNNPQTLFGGADAVKALGGRYVMVAGDATGNGVLSYVGPGNDRDAVLLRIGGEIPTNTVSGYHVEDLNMDGVVSYVGAANDRDIVLQNLESGMPTDTRAASLP